MQWTLPRSPPLHLLLGSALLLTLAAAATVDVSIDGALDNPTLKKAVEVAARQITSKSNATVGLDASNAAIHIVVRVDTAIGPESFAIATLPSGDDGGVSVTGGDARGVYYGLGKLLRGSSFGTCFTPSSWRGYSSPVAPNGFRAMYLATHLQNFYQAAPIDEVQTYIEDLALWGANTVTLVLPWEEFDSFSDPKMVQQLQMMVKLFTVAQGTGLSVGLVAAANQGFRTRPQNIEACYPLPNDHFGEFNAKMPQVSVVKPGGTEYLLNNYRQLFQAFLKAGVTLDFWVAWPYDEGGSACTVNGVSEWPWGAVGFPNITHQVTLAAKHVFPKMRTIVSTWGFDRPESNEFSGLDSYIKRNPGAFDFTMADSNTDFPAWPVKHRHGPGELPLLNFPEISMWGRTPWGGFGANPMPSRFQTLWEQADRLVSGGMPYSEGIYDDINQAICFRHYWNGSETALSTLQEYISFEYGNDQAIVSTVTDAIGLLELDYPLSAEAGQCFPPHCSHAANSTANYCRQALELLQGISSKLSVQASSAWRWRILLDRAIIDVGLDETHGQVIGPDLKHAFADLTEIYHAENAYPAVRPPNASAHNCSAPDAVVSTCSLDPNRGAFIPWVREGNVSTVWGVKPSGAPAMPLLGTSPNEMGCRAKCEANANCTQYVWRPGVGQCFGRCDNVWVPHPTPTIDNIVSARRVKANEIN